MEFKTDPTHLIKQAQAGDMGAFDELYIVYLTPVYRYVFLRVGHKQTAEDLTQAVFLKVFKNLENFTDFQKPPLAYFFTVARNTVIDYFRTNKAATIEGNEELLASLPDTGDGLQQKMHRESSTEAIHKVIANLEGQQQEVITLKYIHDLTTAEIAEILNKTEEAVRQLQSRALKNLRVFVKKSEELF